MKLPRRFPALACRNYRIFWGGQLISLTGTWMQSVAQGWLVYTLTRSPVLLALTAVALTAPVLLLSIPGGLAADRCDRRRLLLLTQSLSIIPAVALALASVAGLLTPLLIVALALAQGVVNAVEMPARQAYWAELLPRRYRYSGNQLNAVSFNATRILGPALAGVLIAMQGTALCFLLNAVSFLAGILALLAIEPRQSPVQPPRRDVGGLLEELCEGLRYLQGQPEQVVLILLVAVISLFAIPFVPLLPVYAESILKVGPQGLGWLSAAGGVGSLVAALMMAWRGEVRRKGRLIAAAGLLVAVCLWLFAHSEIYRLSLLALALVGMGVVALLASVSCCLHHACPDRLRGRVMGIYTLVLVGMAPLGHALMALMTAGLGVVGALSCGALVCGAAVLCSARPLFRMA